MKLKFSALLLFFFSFLFLLFPVKNAFADTFSLTGNIQTSSGQAIGNAAIHIYNPGTQTDVVTPTTSDTTTGNYTFNTVPSGTYDVQVTPLTGSGFSSAIALSQNISTNTVLNFILTPTGTVTISGKILDPLGNPVSGQGVVLFITGGSQVGSVTTDSTGYYSFQTSSGSYHITVNGNNNNNVGVFNVPEHYQLLLPSVSYSQSTLQNITVPASNVTVHVQDGSGHSLSGVVLTTGGSLVNESNLPIGGGVTVSGSNGYNNIGKATDASGNATMWLFPGTNKYTIFAVPQSGSGFANTTFTNNTISGNTTLTLTMPQPITISGHIYDALGNAVTSQSMILFVTGGTNQAATASTDTTGFYSFFVSPGSYNITVNGGNNGNESINVPDHYQFSLPDVMYTQSTTQDINVPVKKVSIRVQNGLNSPVSNVTLSTGGSLVNQSNLSIGGGITVSGKNGYNTTNLATDASGNATMWLFPGTNKYTITATPPSGSGLTTTNFPNISITNDTNLTFTLTQPITISGHIYDALGNAVTGQGLVLYIAGGTNQVGTATTDSTGAYAFQTNVGNYHITVNGGNNGNSANKVPDHYQLLLPDTAYGQTTVQDISVPVKKVTVHVQDPVAVAVAGVQLSTGVSLINQQNLSIGGGLTVNGSDGYDTTNLATDASGNATMWLFPGTNPYTIIANPPSSSVYKQFILNNVTVSGDQTELVALQYNHATPTTTATLSPAADGQGNYSDPTTVTLTAAADSGYTIANTYYTLDGGSQQTYASPFTVSGSGSHTITYWSVDNSGVPEAANTKTFTILTTYKLTGTVFNDANQNGFQDPGESGVSGATITLNTNQTATTDSNGNYTFTGLVPGTYTETLTVPDGDIATTTNPATISLSADTTQNFGVAQAGPVLVTAINAGDGTQGNYGADTDYTNGSVYSSSASVDTSGVTNPAPEAVYQTVRYGNTFGYTIPGLTPGGTYTVRLHFNELYWGTSLAGNNGGVGSRVFNVAINGTQVLSNFDIYNTAGGANKALTEQFPVTPDSSGNVTINFTSVTDNAMVNGVEVYSGTLPSPTPTPTPTPATSAIINAGGTTVGSYQADNSFSGGSTYSSTAAVDASNVTNPAPEAVYQSVRYGNTFAYNVSNLTPNTNFLVRLHFNELYWTSAGQRVFNVSVNGNQVLSNFDVFQQAGGANKAFVEDVIEQSDSTGKINITFTSVTNNAMVSGIEIVQPSIPQRTYYTANDGTNFTRSTNTFVSGVATQAVNSDGSITESVNSAPGYADSGFVLYEGTLGNLPNFTTIGTGDGYGLNLWFDTNNDNEYFAWDSNNVLTGLNGDTYALSNGSQNGLLNINGGTSFFLMSNGQSYSLANLKAGLAPGITANTKVAVWIGVNTTNGSTSSTIQSVNGL